MTLPMLIQIDKLVQLLESPVFTYLRLQLLEPERYPYLYKCLYGLLMLLPQSSAFAALKNRLNSVSAIGYLHVAAVSGGGSREGALQQGRYAHFSSPLTHRPAVPAQATAVGTQNPAANERRAPAAASAASSFERPNRLKSRDEAGVRWTELLEKFRATQERARRARPGVVGDEGAPPPVPEKERRAGVSAHEAGFGQERRVSPVARAEAQGGRADGARGSLQEKKHKGGLGGIGRFAGVGGRKAKR